jgi:predicted nucleic acid-binding protein
LTRGIADTSVFIARESGRRIVEDDLPDELAISVITIGELRSGVLAAVDVETRDRRLATLTEALALDPLPVDQAVAEAWARLRVLLRDMQKRIPVNDSWIAATAMSLGVPVVTQDDDYVEVPGLKILRVRPAKVTSKASVSE